MARNEALAPRMPPNTATPLPSYRRRASLDSTPPGARTNRYRRRELRAYRAEHQAKAGTDSLLHFPFG